MNRDNIETVRKHYNENARTEWARLEYNIFEFQFTTWMMDKYVRPGDSILDIGGGPGRATNHNPQPTTQEKPNPTPTPPKHRGQKGLIKKK